MKKKNSKAKIQHQEGSIFSDSERFEKLVNLDFSFSQCFLRDPIEAKYANFLRLLREKYYRYKTNTITGSGTGHDH